MKKGTLLSLAVVSFTISSTYASTNTVRASELHIGLGVSTSGYNNNFSEKVLEEKEDITFSITPDVYILGNQNITGKFMGPVLNAKVYVNNQLKHSYNSSSFDFKNNTFSLKVSDLNLGSPSLGLKDEVKIILTDWSGNEIAQNIVSIEEPALELGNIIPKVYTTGASSISGSYTGPGCTSELYINGKLEAAYFGESFRNGAFDLKVKPNLISQKDQIRIILKDNQGREIANSRVQVKEGNLKVSLTPDNYKVGSSSITGTYTGPVYAAFVYLNGNKLGMYLSNSFSEGNFEIYLGYSSPIRKGDQLEIILLDGNYSEMVREQVNIGF